MEVFDTTIHAKCVIAGEHAVLRGHPALVFPINSKKLRLTYSVFPNNSVVADFDAPYGENLLIFLWGLIQTSMKLLNKSSIDLHGKFFLQNEIPMGSGMGFSSAICVAVTKWLIWNNWLTETELFNFARMLEDNFHGKSSGVDIAGVLANEGILFRKDSGFEIIKRTWQPHLYISSSKQFSATTKCIKQVELLWKNNKKLAEYLDHEMEKSVLLAQAALAMEQTEGLLHLAQALNYANCCFEQWGLVTSELQDHMRWLLVNGAVAVKPTGSGAGGYILSLWKEKPATELCKELIPLF